MLNACTAAARTKALMEADLDWLNKLIDKEVRTTNNTFIEVEKYLLTEKEIEFIEYKGYSVECHDGKYWISWYRCMYTE